MGKHLQDSGVKYILAPNYQAGKDVLSGFKRHYKGNIVAGVSKLGQSDFQADYRLRRPSHSHFNFQLWWNGYNFIKQWKQAGMDSVSKLYTVFAVDGVSLPAPSSFRFFQPRLGHLT